VLHTCRTVTSVQFPKRFAFSSLKTGARSRVYVPAFGLGTPVLTTCGKAAQKFKLES
jgi:hypothetical protein